MAQFVLTLLVGLALLMSAASGVVRTTAREWFERDVSSRAQLVLVRRGDRRGCGECRCFWRDNHAANDGELRAARFIEVRCYDFG